MAVELKLPQLGVEMDSAHLREWLCAGGESVAEGNPVAVVETDKVMFEVKAPASGVLCPVAVIDEEYAVGDVLAHIAADADEYAELLEHQVAAGPSIADPTGATPSAACASEPDVGSVEPVRTPRRLPADSNGTPDRAIRATPLARRVAEQNGLLLTSITGTGPRQTIRRRDVEAALEARETPSPQPASVPALAPSTKIPLTSMRRAIATHMHQSLMTTAQMTDVREISVTRLVELRKRLSAKADKIGFNVSFMGLLARATALALRQVPELNATSAEDHVTQYSEVHLGVAVAIADGLLVPVIRRADQLSLRELHEQMTHMIEKTRSRALSAGELSGGTFTLTNIGSYGSHFGTPVLNSPQVGILAVGAIQEKPVIEKGEIVIGRTMFASLTVDHRIIDGQTAGRFQSALADLLGDPETLLVA